MTKVVVTKKDVIWSYVAQFFNLGSGLITLPLILSMLSAEEIGMNYLMITVSTMVGLLDFGFAPQFARNITYVFAGVHELKKEGVAESNGYIDYNLLNNMIEVAKMVYSRLALLTLFIMLTFGSIYIYYVTDGFLNVGSPEITWIVYSISVYFNVYYFYYSSLLTGRGLVSESKKAMIAQRLTYIILTFLLLFAGTGLLGVVIANLISPFVGRFFSYRYFYDAEINKNLISAEKSKEKQKELFGTIWYNAKKLGLVFLGSYAINRFGMFIAGLFLPLREIASYGLMIQIFSIITAISTTFNSSVQPEFASFRTEGNNKKLLERFSYTMIVYYSLFVAGSCALIFIGPYVLDLIKSNAELPAMLILVIYAVILLLENNHSMFATLIVTDNKVPFVESSIICGIAICVFSYLSLRYTESGLLGLVLVQGVCQIVYSNWKWPYVVCRQFNISFLRFLKIGIVETSRSVVKLCHA